MAHNSSVAYDLSAYEAPKQRAKPELKVVKRARSGAAALFNLRILSSFAIVVSLLSLIIYNQVQLTEVTGQINRLTSELSELENENLKMTSELESTMSLRMIGEQAKSKLGMNRLDQYQTVYICLEQEDKVALTEYSPNQPLSHKIQSKLTEVIASIQEYISKD